jgi:hypothetical protein
MPVRGAPETLGRAEDVGERSLHLFVAGPPKHGYSGHLTDPITMLFLVLELELI